MKHTHSINLKSQDMAVHPSRLGLRQRKINEYRVKVQFTHSRLALR